MSPVDLPEPFESIAKTGLEAVDQTLDMVVVGLSALRAAVAALDVRVEALEAAIQ